MTAQAHIKAIPHRARPFEKTQQPTPALLRKLLGRDLAPSRDEFSAVLDALNVGDPAMDSLVDWMMDYGPRESRALFETAITEGLAAVPDCPEPLWLFIKSLERRPAWVDFDLIDEGARFIHSTGMTAPYVLRDLALMGGYLLSGFNQSLVLTGALNQGASRRIAETGKWWIDCTEEGGLKRFGAGFRGTLHVRLVHSLVRRNLAAREEWDADQWGLPLSQVDMVATYLGFCVVMLGGLRKMGVDETWLVDREQDGIVLLHHTLMTQSKPDWTSQELGKALAAEPLERHFKRFESLRRKLAYQKHLSVSRYFLSRDKMEQLGLPGSISAWYPLATLLPRLVSFSCQRYLPGLRQWQCKQGRVAQRKVLAQMFGEAKQDLIRPDANHPGHT